MRTDGRTDMTKVIPAFRNFANRRKNRGKPVVKHLLTICRDNSEPPHILFQEHVTCNDAHTDSKEC